MTPLPAPWSRRFTACAAAGALVLLAACSEAAEADTSGTTGATSDSASTTTLASLTDSQAGSGIGDILAANTDPHEAADWDAATAVEVVLDQVDDSVSGVTSQDGTVTITEAGTYRLTGTLTDGQVVVDVAEGDVVLLLDGVDITSSTSAALYIASGDTTIVLADGSTNTLTDAEEYVYPDADTDEPKAALYAADDLTITGTGELSVHGTYNDGISTKDGLVIAGGTIVVDAVDDGIRGKDYLVVTGGDITVTSGGDALKSDNEDDASLGYVLLSGGALDLTAGDDGVQAQTDAIVDGATVTVTAAGGAGATVADDASAKGIKGTVLTVVASGSVTVDAADDGLHSDGDVLVLGGSVTVAAGDDGVHADLAAVVSDGELTVTSSTEGLEGTTITIEGGSVDLTASDDAINAAGDAGDPMLTIAGGTVVLDAGGDGFDSNGDALISGGTVVVHGPQNSGNGAIDVDRTFDVSGGTLIAVGAEGMAQTPAESSQQSWIAATFSTLAEGELLQITDTDGTVLASLTTRGGVSSVVFSSPEVDDDGTYTIWTGGTQTGSEAGGLSTDGDVSEATELTTAGTRTAVAGGMPGGGQAPGGADGGQPPSGTDGGQAPGGAGGPGSGEAPSRP